MTSPCLVLLRGAAKRRRKCQGEFVALDPIVAARTVDDDMGGIQYANVDEEKDAFGQFDTRDEVHAMPTTRAWGNYISRVNKIRQD